MRVYVCVPLVVTGIHSDCVACFLFFVKQGDRPCAVSDGPTKRPQYTRISADHRDVPAMVGTFEQAVIPLSCKGLMSLAGMRGRRHLGRSAIVVFDLSFGPHLRFRTSRTHRFRCSSQDFGFLGCRVALLSSQCAFLLVCLSL